MRCRATHFRPTHGGRHPCPRFGGHGSLRDLHGVRYLVALPRPMGSLEAIRGHSDHGAHGKPLQIAGKTQHLDIQWGEARGRASFIVIVGLESPPCLIGMDIMRPLRVHIDLTNGTATPAQPDPQTVHLNAAQSQQRRQEKLLPGTGSPFSQATGPPPAPLPQKEKPLPEAGSPASRPASPPHIPQLQEGTSLPRAPLSPGGTADSSLIQPQRKKCRCLELGCQLLLPRRFLTQPPPPTANSQQVLHCRMPHRALPPLTPLAELGCSKQQTSPLRRLASSAATIRGLPRTSFFALTTLYRPL